MPKVEWRKLLKKHLRHKCPITQTAFEKQIDQECLKFIGDWKKRGLLQVNNGKFTKKELKVLITELKKIAMVKP